MTDLKKDNKIEIDGDIVRIDGVELSNLTKCCLILRKKTAPPYIRSCEITIVAEIFDLEQLSANGIVIAELFSKPYKSF